MKYLFFASILTVSAAACSAPPEANPSRAEPKVEEKSNSSNGDLDGKQLYADNCALCHGETGNAMLNGAKDLTKSNLNLNGICYIVQNGSMNGKMASFSSKLNADQIQAVSIYAVSLKGE